MTKKQLLSLLICGNKGKDGKFKDKIHRLTKINNVSIDQTSVNRLIFKLNNISFDIFLIQGKQDAVELSNRLCHTKEIIILNGACCSLDENLEVGTLFLPRLFLNERKKWIGFSSELGAHIKRITERYCQSYVCGKIIKVDDLITSPLYIKKLDIKSRDTCIDQETTIVGEACNRTKTMFGAILYVSDNLSLEQSPNVVNSDPTLFPKKKIAKRLSLEIALRTLCEWQKRYESL